MLSGTHVMVDLETLATTSQAAIISIGAVKFTADKITDTLYSNILASSSAKRGLTIDPDTVKWWTEPSQDARDALEVNPRDLKDVLVDFSQWISSTPFEGL
jgi:DNA polymerase III epsilon subunit-like protein